MKNAHFPIFLVLLVVGGGLAGANPVTPQVETDPVPHSGDAADDPAIWLHPTDSAQSVVIGTDKRTGGGLAVYDLAGNQLHFHADGRMNNVDVRYGFPLGGQKVDIVAAGNRTDDSIAVYRIDPATRQLQDITARTLSVGVTEAYGFALYHSWLTGKYYALVNDKDGDVEQWELFDDGSGQVDARLVRSFDVGTQTEGMVADDRYGDLYIGEENVGIWKYGAEPGDGTARVQVDTCGGGNLVADVEGLAILQTTDGEGYLLASSQGDNTFAVYERTGNNDYLKQFWLVAGGGIDSVGDTDGIEVISTALGTAFPQGLFVAQDGSNPGANQNFKLAAWDDIAGAGSPTLDLDPTWDPRWMIPEPLSISLFALIGLTLLKKH